MGTIAGSNQNFDTSPPADETTATTGNTGFPAVTIGAGAAIKWDSDTPHTGTRSLRFDVGNPASFTIVNPVQSATDVPDLYVRGYARMLNLPAANATISAIYNATPALTAGLQYTTTGALRIRNGTTTIATSTTTFGALTWFGFEWHLDDVANTQTLRIYDATFSDIRETISGSFTGTNTRRWQIGNVSGNPNSWQQWWDDLIANDTTFPGPLGSPQATNIWRVPNGVGGWTGAEAKIQVSGSWVG